MKKTSKFKLLLLTGLFLLISATHTYAVPVAPADSYTGGFFSNAEVIVDQNDTPGTIDAGDLVWGVLVNQNIIDAGTDPSGQTGSDIWLRGAALGGPVEITGYFLQEVISVTSGGGPGTDLITFGAASFDPNGIFTNAELAAGAILKFYESDTLNYNTSTQGLGLATATDGTATWLLSAEGGYVYSYAPAAIPALGEDVGIQYGGLNFLDPDSSLFQDIDDPNETMMNTLVDFFYNSEIFRLNTNQDLLIGANETFHFGSNDPWVVKSVVPEPATALLLGIGLLALSSIGRRRNKI